MSVCLSILDALLGVLFPRADPVNYSPLIREMVNPPNLESSERIMVFRLKECYNEGPSEFQFGFREGRSVEDAWLHVKSSVGGSSAKYVLGIFVDFKGAFDYLSWDRVLARLEEIGCRELELWRSYFRDRKACVVVSLVLNLR